MLNERKQYEGVQFCIPVQFHGLLKRCRKAISSIEEIPEGGVCSIVLRQNALLLNDGDHSAVYVPCKTILAVVSLEKDHDNKLVKAVFQDIKGNKYIAKDVTPLVAYILVPTKRTTLEQYISGDNLRHSKVVTFDDIDENDVASNDPMEFKKLKTILAGQVRVITIEEFDFVVAFAKKRKGSYGIVDTESKAKEIHAKLTTFASDMGKADFICNNFVGCSYDEVITSKLYTIYPQHNTICHISVKIPSHLDNVYEPDPTWVANNEHKTIVQPRTQRFDSTPTATAKHIDQRMSKSESDIITEDDVYDLVECASFSRFEIADNPKQNKDNSKMMRYTVSQDSFSHVRGNSNIDGVLAKSHLGLSYNPKMQVRRQISSEEEDKYDDDSLYLTPLSRQDTEVLTRRVESSKYQEANTNNNCDQTPSKNSNDDSKEDSVYMPMDGTCSLRNRKDSDDIEESEYVVPLKHLQGPTGDYEETDEVESLKIVEAHTGDYDATGGVLALERSQAETCDNEETDDVETLTLEQWATCDFVAPDDVEALKCVQDIAGDYENPDDIEELRPTGNLFHNRLCNRKQHRHARSKYVNLDYSDMATEEQNYEVFETAAAYIPDDEIYDAPKSSRHVTEEVFNNESESGESDCQIYEAPTSSRSLSEDLINSFFESDGQIYDAPKSTRSLTGHLINIKSEIDVQMYDAPKFSRSVSELYDAPKTPRSVTEELINSDTESDGQIYDAPKTSSSVSEVYDAPKSSRSVSDEFMASDTESDGQIYDVPQSSRYVTELCNDRKSPMSMTKDFKKSEREYDCGLYDAPKSSRSMTGDFKESESETDCELYDAPKSSKSVTEDLLNTDSQSDSQIYDAPKSATRISAESTARGSIFDNENEFVSKAEYFNEIAEYVNLGSFHREGGVRLS